MCFRILISVSLLLAAGLCGSLSYFALSRVEHRSFETHYKSQSKHMLDAMARALLRAQKAAEEVAYVIGTVHPNTSTWPNASVIGFQGMFDLLADISDPRVIANAPIVPPGEIENAKFEAYASSVFATDPGFPENAGCVCGFCGVCSTNDTSGQAVYHDTIGRTAFSKYDLITPFLNIASVDPTPSHLFNIHSAKFYGEVMDAVYECSLNNSWNDCSSLTGPETIFSVSLAVSRSQDCD